MQAGRGDVARVVLDRADAVTAAMPPANEARADVLRLKRSQEPR